MLIAKDIMSRVKGGINFRKIIPPEENFRQGQCQFLLHSSKLSVMLNANSEQIIRFGYKSHLVIMGATER
jgi:hypothetical protein